MNYKKIYENLINKASNRSSLGGYVETHHIVPRCMGGDESKENLVDLTAKEHFIAHLHLVKIYPDNTKVKFAFNMMLNKNGYQERVTGKKYERYKKINSNALSKLHKGRKFTKEHREKISRGLTGRIISEETKKKNSAWQKGGKKPWQNGRVPHPNFTGPNNPRGTGHSRKPTEAQKKESSERVKRELAPTLNTSGYQILTPSGFQFFDGVKYSGLIPILKFVLICGRSIRVSTHHRFDHSSKRADEYVVGEFLKTETGFSEITSIDNAGKSQTYDIINAHGGNLYYGDGIVNHNCDVTTEEKDAVVPEFITVEQDIVKTWERPLHYDGYVSMDIGFTDLTGVIFGYYDFVNAKLIISNELVLSGTQMLTDNLAALVAQKEEESFPTKIVGVKQDPYKRVADNNNPILLQDLSVKHGLTFMPTDKDNFEAALNNMRILIKTKKIIIDPKCVTLIRHLKGAIWNKQRNNFKRDPNNGHYDLVSSLIYLCRNVDFSRNPYPKDALLSNYHYTQEYIDSQKPASEFEKAMTKVLKPKFGRFRR